MLKVHNAGRAPALRLRIDFTFALTDSTQGDVAWWPKKPSRHGGAWDEGRDYPFIVEHALTGHGHVAMPLLGALQSALVNIENRMGAPVTLTPTAGSVSPLSGDEEVTRLGVQLGLAEDGVFQIRASTRETPDS